MMLQNGPLALGHKGRRGLGQLLGEEGLRCVGGVRLAQGIGTVVQPCIGIGMNVSIVSVRQEVAAHVGEGKRQIATAVVGSGFSAANPVDTVIGNDLRPSRGGSA